MEYLGAAWDLEVGQRAVYERLWAASLPRVDGNLRLLFVLWLALSHSAPVYGLNLLYTAFTRLAPAASERWRFLPGKRASGRLVLKAFVYVTAFHVAAPFIAYAMYPAAIRRMGSEDALFAPSAVPGLGKLAFQLLVCYLCTDATFYWGHRALHVPALYKLIHKQHHEFNVSVGFAAQYAHPLELVLGNVVPVLFGFVAFRMHFVVWCLWTAIALLGTTAAHSGLWYPGATKGFHDWHHSANIGNYGSLPLWDWLCGTDRGWARRRAELAKRFN
jgi:sterol desaturase/sphingolipid hydroxylase (fatty acid hydroxylase superfamily)